MNATKIAQNTSTVGPKTSHTPKKSEAVMIRGTGMCALVKRVVFVGLGRSQEAERASTYAGETKITSYFAGIVHRKALPLLGYRRSNASIHRELVKREGVFPAADGYCTFAPSAFVSFRNGRPSLSAGRPTRRNRSWKRGFSRKASMLGSI
jgi:hypothetical protein